jgi:hypothetical protein
MLLGLLSHSFLLHLQDGEQQNQFFVERACVAVFVFVSGDLRGLVNN